MYKRKTVFVTIVLGLLAVFGYFTVWFVFKRSSTATKHQAIQSQIVLVNSEDFKLRIKNGSNRDISVPGNWYDYDLQMFDESGNKLTDLAGWLALVKLRMPDYDYVVIPRNKTVDIHLSLASPKLTGSDILREAVRAECVSSHMVMHWSIIDSQPESTNIFRISILADPTASSNTTWLIRLP